MDDLLDDDIAHELAEPMKLFVSTADLPVSGLSGDVAEVERFEVAAGPITSVLRLICESPPLTPAAAVIVEGAVRIWGDFFSGDWRISHLVDGQGWPDCGNRVSHPHEEGISGKCPDS
ncbi:hypothetical protein [Paraburkholderia ultramafica]|uniref:hypothetical protein n=1 Tax=Paraburkholderia ultramafica TaxID=1544867 RepID=UPI001581AB7B|nr:hypothetical protein [Paraburkholderia ultramafica]